MIGVPVDTPAPSMEQMFLLVYNELHQLAARKLRSERDGHTLSTTALVNEAWLELNKLNRIQWQNRAHFLAVAAQAMRRILIDYAVARRREKRGGGQVPLSLDDNDALAIVHQRADELGELAEAIARLQQISDSRARIVECRFYSRRGATATAERSRGT